MGSWSVGMRNTLLHDSKPTVSSWRIFSGMLPGALKFIRVIIMHPIASVNMMRMAYKSKKHLLANVDIKEVEYIIPEYRQGMLYKASKVVYCRPTRYIEVDAPEIIAMANQLGAYAKPDRDFVSACFDFVKMKVKFTFAAQLRGAVGTLKIGEGMCVDKTHLFISLCRAGGIPARFRVAQQAFSQNIYEHLTETDPIMKEWYNSTGYFLLHMMAEAYINGEWVPADFSMDYRYEAALGLPISQLGDEPEGTWSWAVPGSVIRCEVLPPFFTFFMSVMFKFNTTMFLSLQERMENEGLQMGIDALKEAGGVEAYDKKVRRTYKAILPEVSKKLFKAMMDTETKHEKVTNF